MPGVRAVSSPPRPRRDDLAAWAEADLSSLGEREKQRYEQRKNAVVDYYTTDKSIEEITRQYRLSWQTLERLLEKCLKRHPDGRLWGFRALLPGSLVEESVEAPLTSVPAPAHGGQEKPSEEQSEGEQCTNDTGRTPSAAVEGEATSADELAEGEEPTVRLEVVRGGRIQRQSDTLEAIAAGQGEAHPVDQDQNGHKRRPISLSEEEPPASAEAEGDNHPRPAERANHGQTAAEEGEEAEGAQERRAEAGEEEEQTPTISLEGPEEEEETPTLPLEGEQAPEEPVPARGDVSARGLAEAPTRSLEAEIAQAPETTAGKEQEPQRGTEAGRVASEEKLSPEIDELPTTLLDERMLPAPLQEEAEIALFPGCERELVDLAAVPTTVLPLAPGQARDKKRLPPGIAARRLTQQLRRLRGRRRERTQVQRKRYRFRTYVTLAILVALIIGLLPPVGAALAAYSAYSNVKSLAEDGVKHLMNVKDLLTLDKNNPLAALEADKLQRAQQEFRLAGSDFLQLQQLVDRDDVREAIQRFAPEYASSLDMARHLVQVALDVSRMGDEMSGVGLLAASIIHGSPLTTSSNAKPLLTAQDVATVQGALVHALYYIDDIEQQMRSVDLKQLPMLNAHQREQIAGIVKVLPTAQKQINQVQQLIPLASWLLGVDGHRRYLLQTMDNAELRPGGGFTGQYGVVDVQNGVVGALALRDVAKLDYAGNGFQMGRQAPPGYSWMHMGNFGLRDSNVSGDYPTTARINIQVFQDEGGGPVDGDIAFTPTFIAHILDVTGPIVVKDYGETITSQNLADRLHYYQQDPAGIARQEQVTGQGLHDARKAFTSLVAKLLLDKVRHLPVSKLLDIVKGAVRDIQARDLELYFTNPAVEAWLVQQGYSGAINSFKSVDGFHVVQANISVNKASQYVHSTFQDNITLDAQGGATHDLTIILEYDQRGPVYGFDAYTDYIRVYAPEGAQLLDGGGFDSGQPVCSASTGLPKATTGTTSTSSKPPATGSKCDSYNYIPPDGSRYCPSGNYALGPRYQNPPVDSVGPPTALQSDLPGRAMWGGLTVTPKNCTSYIRLSWYVPHAHINLKNPADIYSVLVGKQGGMVPTVDITIDATALHLKGVSTLHYHSDIHKDQVITLKGPQTATKTAPKAASSASAQSSSTVAAASSATASLLLAQLAAAPALVIAWRRR
ncbi:DUF4012 domain-containing protein [Thermogemmatispora tikiterensis]|uniref:DUF4012 domain-containing protein n=1 Tax=Thermogemmatispora tikiterensis TaxID=1825093 RepID=A0A328VPT6_9CHLR|nr:DUF4012 domain-containing protein [Thermogemmatispora tikiterensis]RAQ97184.1 hypothetical protein A4R35_16720 [Thermogemmatispora tikiterensis]